jgi:ABC-2 type transport system permease protein
MSAFVGIRPLIRLILRRDRFLLPILTLLPAVMVGATAAAFVDLYPTDQSREQFATLMATNPGITAFLGPLHGTSIGALTFWRTVIVAVMLAALPGVFMVIRHTRAEEQAGRRELIGSTVVGRHAPLAAALLVAAIWSILMGAGVSASLLATGQPTAGSLAAGAAWAGFALAGVGIGALTAQLFENPRTARGLAGGILAIAYVLRIVGDVAGGALAWLSWVSPIGWMHEMRPFDGDRWAVLAMFIAFAAITTAAAAALSTRRDLDAGIWAPRPGPATASRGLSSPNGLAWRLHRGSFVGWTTGIAAYGVIVGGLGPSMAEVLEDNPQLKEIFDRIGGEGAFIDIFLAAGLGFIGLIGAAYAVQAALRLRGEELVGHAETILATPVDRVRFAGSHALMGSIGPAVAILAGGLTAGVAYGLVTADLATQAPRLLIASAAYVPAALVMGALTVALFGLFPRASSWAWSLLVTFLLLGQLGPILGIDQTVMNLSPFTHTPAVPGSSMRVAPLVGLTVTAGALLVAGLAGFRRRDAAIG